MGDGEAGLGCFLPVLSMESPHSTCSSQARLAVTGVVSYLPPPILPQAVQAVRFAYPHWDRPMNDEQRGLNRRRWGEGLSVRFAPDYRKRRKSKGRGAGTACPLVAIEVARFAPLDAT